MGQRAYDEDPQIGRESRCVGRFWKGIHMIKPIETPVGKKFHVVLIGKDAKGEPITLISYWSDAEWRACLEFKNSFREWMQNARKGILTFDHWDEQVVPRQKLGTYTTRRIELRQNDNNGGYIVLRSARGPELIDIEPKRAELQIAKHFKRERELDSMSSTDTHGWIEYDQET